MPPSRREATGRAARSRLTEIREIVHFQLLHYLVAVVDAAARHKSELATLIRLPSTSLTNQAFATAVRTLIEAARPEKPLLVAKGMSETLLDDLDRLIGEFEAVIEAARTGRRDHIRARLDLELIAELLLEDVRVLGGFYGSQFGQDVEFMLEWEAVRHIPGMPQPREKTEPVDRGEEASPRQGDAPAA